MQPVILIADDHGLIRKGLKLYMKFDMGYTDIQEVASCHELMNELVKKKYTHLVLDIILSDGNTLEIIPNIRKVYPDLNILVFSMQPEEIYANALQQYDIRQYLSKTADESEIIKRLGKFLQNEADEKSTNGTNLHNPFSSLSPRELEILHYLLKGSGTKEISNVLNIKMNTVSTLKTRIFEKTKSGSTRELLELASLYNINY
ncbi:MAG: response regulator transcription factor [Bacteroidota bacterium]